MELRCVGGGRNAGCPKTWVVAWGYGRGPAAGSMCTQEAWLAGSVGMRAGPQVYKVNTRTSNSRPAACKLPMTQLPPSGPHLHVPEALSAHADKVTLSTVILPTYFHQGTTFHYAFGAFGPAAPTCMFLRRSVDMLTKK